MTDTERYVNGVCERIMASGQVRLYRDVYKDLRERHPCDVACKLVAGGLRRTRILYRPDGVYPSSAACAARARAIAALERLERYAGRLEWQPWEQLVRDGAGGV